MRNAERGLATAVTPHAIARARGVTIDELTGRAARPSAPHGVLKETDAAVRQGAK